MLMHNPPHLGKVVKRALIDGTGLTVTDLFSVTTLYIYNL